MPQETPKAIVVCALYQFVDLPQFAQLRQGLLSCLLSQGVKGTLLLAQEGINGTIAGPRSGIDQVLAYIKAIPGLAGLDHKESYEDQQPFLRTKVKLKQEIVTLGVPGIDPKRVVGTYVEPKQWNALISDPEVLLIDTRNDYEVAIGTFQGAINPSTETFREFPEYVKQHLDPGRHKKVAMFCTGGIRCEKSTAYLKEQGFDEVYHLHGGILKYLEEVPEQDSLWQGECFVFDNRVAVNHQLKKGQYDQCHACRRPITEHDKQHPHYQQGISCHHCHAEQTPEQRQRYQERERQMQLAKERGAAHLGGEAVISMQQQRQLKQRKRQAQQLAANPDAGTDPA